MSRLLAVVLFVCLTINAFAGAQLWNENRKELVIFNSDGNAVKLRTIDRPSASKISADRSLTYTVNSNGTRLDIYQNLSGNLKKSVDLNGRIKQVETNQSGSLLFLLDEASQSIRIFDALTFSEKSSLHLKSIPATFAYNSARDEFYVGFQNATISAIKNDKERAIVSDLYRTPKDIHFSNKWRNLIIRTESFVAVYDLDDFSFKGFVPFEGRPGRIEFDSDENFAFIEYTDRAKIEKFRLDNFRSEDVIYPNRKNFNGKKIDPSTFHLSQDSLQFYDAESAKSFQLEEASSAMMGVTPTTLPPGVTAGSNIDINEEDDGAQYSPSMQVDSSNNMVFTWTTDPTQSGAENIKGREFNSNGTPAGSEFRVNQTIVWPQNSSMVAVRDNGDFIAIWNEQSERDGQGWGIWGRRFAAGGVELDALDLIIPSNPIGKQVYPVVAFGNGVYIAAWAGPTDGDGRGVWMRRFNAANGLPLDLTEIAVNTSTAGEPWALDIAANPSGEFIICWRDDSQSKDRIRIRVYNSNGTPKTPTDVLVGPYNVGAQRNFSPNVGIAHDGSYVVVWLEAGAGGIVGERFDANGTSLGKFLATTGQTEELQDNPSVDSAPNGSFLVAWKDAGYTMFEAIGRYFNNTGAPQGNDFRIPETAPVNDDFSPTVAMTEQNNFVVAWYGRGRSPNIMARMFTVPPTGPSLSINNVSLFETDAGTIQAVFTVSVFPTTNSTITVNYATADNSATTADNDYESASGILTIPANNPSGTISVTINGDTTVEPSEQFFVNLSNPNNATIADGQGVGTIQDDDAPPVVSIGDISVVEGDAGTANAQFTISISAPLDEQITLDFDTDPGSAQAPADFTDTDLPITIPINTTTFPVNVPIVGDLLDEGNESFTATLSNISSNAVLGDANATATIEDNECIYCDNFNDGVLPIWVFKQPWLWVENGGMLVGDTIGSKKNDGFATPVFPGSPYARVRAGMTSTAGSSALITLIAWNQDKDNRVELQMKEGKDVWTLRHRVNGSIVKKASVSQTIDPDTVYQAEIQFDGTMLHVLINSVEVLTMNATGTLSGTVGFSVRRAIGSLDHITVLP